MTTYTRYSETSPYRCWDCDKQMVIEVKVSDYDGEASLVHCCPVCFDEVVDGSRRSLLRELYDAMRMDLVEAERVVAEASPAVRRLREMRMG